VKVEDRGDQALIGKPRFGFYGVVDERFDLQLLKEVAELRPQWQFIIIGPVVKIDPETLPRFNNIHYLGGKSYDELPEYLSGWDIAMIPFLLNDSTKYISPTKTPEYLAAGKPVISTSIKDVVTPYGINGLVHIADCADDFIKAAEMELNKSDRKKWLDEVDAFFQRVVDDADRLVVVRVAIDAGHRHEAQANRRDVDAAIAERAHFHRGTPG